MLAGGKAVGVKATSHHSRVTRRRAIHRHRRRATTKKQTKTLIASKIDVAKASSLTTRQNTSPPSDYAPPAVVGHAVQGQTVDGASGNWTGSPSYAYKWLVCNSAGASCTTLAGVTGGLIVLNASEVSHTIKVMVTATNAGGSASATSPPSAVVAASTTSSAPSPPPPPPPPAAPVAAFSFSPAAPVTGSAVSFNASATSCAASPCSYSWADDPPSGGTWPLGTGQSMSFTFTGVGTKYVTLTVTDNQNRTATIEHNVVVSAPAAPAAPANTAAPTVSGTTQQGDTLTATSGSWSGSPTSYSYAWRDCGSSGTTCTAIAGATAQTYTLAAGDVGQKVEAAVTATNAGGSVSAASAPTAAVTAAPAPPQSPSPPSSSTNCLSSPSSCGYPDVAAGNVGVSNCSSLPSWSPADLPSGTYSSSGDQVNITANNVTITGYNIGNYFFYVEGSHFTLNGDCVSFDGSDWSGGSSSATTVWGTSSASNLTVENSTLVGQGCSATATSICTGPGVNETLVTSGGAPNAVVSNNVLAGAVEDINGVGNNSTVENNYIVANGAPGGGIHSEDMFEQDVTGLTVSHNTLLNPMDQSAVIFAQVGTSGAACDNQFTITDNLFAGGGWPLMLCAHAGSAGSSAMNISGNEFGRCGASQTGSYIGGSYCGSSAPTAGTAPGAGADSAGYWPQGGFFGLTASMYCGNSGWTWSSNTWDNNGASASCT